MERLGGSGRRGTGAGRDSHLCQHCCLESLDFLFWQTWDQTQALGTLTQAVSELSSTLASPPLPKASAGFALQRGFLESLFTKVRDMFNLPVWDKNVDEGHVLLPKLLSWKEPQRLQAHLPVRRGCSPSRFHLAPQEQSILG